MKKEIVKLLVSKNTTGLGLKRLRETCPSTAGFVGWLNKILSINSVVISNVQNDFGTPGTVIKLKGDLKVKFSGVDSCLLIHIKTETINLTASEFKFDNHIEITDDCIAFDHGNTEFYYSIKDSFIKANNFNDKEIKATEIIQSNLDDTDLKGLVYGNFDEALLRKKWGDHKLVDYDDSIRYTRGINTVSDILNHLRPEQKTPESFYLDSSERYNYQTEHNSGNARECVSPSDTTYFTLRYRFNTVIGKFYIIVGTFTEQRRGVR